MPASKIGGNTTNILNLYFQNKFLLWHIRLNIYIWKTKFTFNKQYFSGLLFSRNAKKTRIDQGILQAFLLFLKKTPHETLKVAAAKNSFPSVFIINTTCFDQSFLFHVITANSIFYINKSLPRGLMQPSCYCVLSNKCLERSPHFMSVVSTMVIVLLRWC